MIAKGLAVTFCGAVLIGALLACTHHAARDLPPKEVEARYKAPTSRFITVDGVRIHYQDEGSGPAVVLIHEAHASLRTWEPWARELRDRYRVIRFDLTGHGLTGPDRTGDYTLARTLQLLDGFVNQLNLQRFALGGSSLGGAIAVHYAARYPQRVDRLILVNAESIRPSVANPGLPFDSAQTFELFSAVAPRLTAYAMLSDGFADASRIPETLVEEWSSLWRREGNRPGEGERLRQFSVGDLESQLQAIEAPVLVMWGDQGSETEVEREKERIHQLLKNAHSVRISVLRGVGRFAIQEDPETTAREARDFLDAGRPDVPVDATPKQSDPWSEPEPQIEESPKFLVRATFA